MVRRTRPHPADAGWRRGDRLRPAARRAGRSDRHDDSAGRHAGRYRRLRAFYGLDQLDPAAVHHLVRPGAARRFRPFDQRCTRACSNWCWRGLPATLELALLATLIAVVLGLAVALIGVQLRGPPRRMAGRRRHRRRCWRFRIFSGRLILLLLFGVLIPLLPTSGRIDPQLDCQLPQQFLSHREPR